jgi:hypothetical protein
MGVAFRPAGCVQSAEECGNESPDIDTNRPPRRAPKIKEKPACGLTGFGADPDAGSVNWFLRPQ